MKKAYCIVNILAIHDPEAFNRYVTGHVPTIHQHGGKFLVKGQAGEVLEGEWASNRVVVHEFPSMAALQQWYRSEDYRPWKALRQSCADVNVLIVEGA